MKTYIFKIYQSLAYSSVLEIYKMGCCANSKEEALKNILACLPGENVNSVLIGICDNYIVVDENEEHILEEGHIIMYQ